MSDRIKRSAMSLTDRERSEKYTVSIPFTKTPKDAAAGGLMKGQNLANLFSDLTVGYHDSIDFNKLPIPFACVAANVVNGEQLYSMTEYSQPLCVPVWLFRVYSLRYGKTAWY